MLSLPILEEPSAWHLGEFRSLRQARLLPPIFPGRISLGELIGGVAEFSHDQWIADMQLVAAVANQKIVIGVWREPSVWRVRSF